MRFYQLRSDDGVSFAEQVERLAGMPKADREKNTADDSAVPFNVRLEDYDATHKPYICGQFVRRTLVNHPPEATADGLKALKLTKGSGLGYPAAFAYAPEYGVLAVEHSPRTLSLARIVLYINLMAFPEGKLTARPVPNKQAWSRYAKGKPRRLTITLANPTNLAAVEGEVGGVLSATGKLNEIFDAPVITIEVSMGHKKGALNGGHVEKILNFFTKGDGRQHDVRSLRASVQPDAGGPSDDLDFLNELLVSRDTLELNGDPVKDYERRKAFVLQELKKHSQHLKAVYG